MVKVSRSKSSSINIIHHLPDDCLQRIFDKLNENRDRCSFGLACHTFFDIQNSCLHLKIKLSARTNVDRLLNRFWRLESLSVKVSIDSTDSDLTRLQNCGSKLCTLDLARCYGISDARLILLASVCPLLSVLNLHDCSITDNGLKTLSESCKLLKEVDLGCCKGVTDNGILSLVQNCGQLRSLDITCCSNFVGESFKGCSKTLARIIASCCNFNSTGLTGLLSGGGVENLDLSFTGNWISGLEAFDLGFGANIKILNVEDCPFVNDDAVMKMSKGCPLLQEWNLSNCYHIGVSGWESIGLYCKNLETLWANNCREFCDAGLLALANGCITSLHAKRWNKITHNGVHAVEELMKTKENQKHMKMEFESLRIYIGGFKM